MAYLNTHGLIKQALSGKTIMNMLESATKKGTKAKEHFLKRLGQRNIAVKNNQLARYNKMMSAGKDANLMAKLEKRVPSNYGLGGGLSNNAGYVTARDILSYNRFHSGPKLGAIKHDLLNIAPTRMYNGIGNKITVNKWTV